MILCPLGPDAPFYRALTPSWAYLPESGAGAARGGGRFNRPGVEARYLAATPEAALLEYQAESVLLPPATVVTYRVTAEAIVDFSGGYEPERWSPIWSEAYCNWKGLAFLENVEPPSWVVGDLVRDAGQPGILYRSVRSAEHLCLVLFPMLAERFRAPVHDPDGRLPKNSDSWNRSTEIPKR
jgi:RES domain-containing protein